mgnify:CR=1 FL=1
MHARTIELTCILEPAATDDGPRTDEVRRLFGLPRREPPAILFERVALRLAPGRLLYVTGPSGGGKSTLMRRVAESLSDVIVVGCDPPPGDAALIDWIAPGRPLAVAMRALAVCGLAEPRLWLRRVAELSAGEHARAALARALAAALARVPKPVVVCDGFAEGLHARLAASLASNLRRLVTGLGLCVIVAGTRDELVADLRPDEWVRLAGPGRSHRSESSAPPRRRPPLKLRVEPGGVRDYRELAALHYRGDAPPGFVDRVFVARQAGDDDVLAVVVYAMPPIELALRNLATAGRFSGNPRRLNRELRILRRLVVHPDVRGRGVGHWLVRRTLPLAGTRFVECLAAMGAVNPLFERAGMTRVGQVVPRGRLALLERLRRLRVDPFRDDFEQRVRDCPRVRRLVERTLLDWRRATTGRASSASESQVDAAAALRRLVSEPPVYYLWDRRGRYPLPVGDVRNASDQCGWIERCRPESTVERREPGNDRHDPRDGGPTQRGPEGGLS